MICDEVGTWTVPDRSKYRGNLMFILRFLPYPRQSVSDSIPSKPMHLKSICLVNHGTQHFLCRRDVQAPAPSAIHSLSNDVLYKILTQHDRRCSWVLSHVCQRWRALSVTSPHLWNTIEFDNQASSAPSWVKDSIGEIRKRRYGCRNYGRTLDERYPGKRIPSINPTYSPSVTFDIDLSMDAFLHPSTPRYLQNAFKMPIRPSSHRVATSMHTQKDRITDSFAESPQSRRARSRRSNDHRPPTFQRNRVLHDASLRARIPT